MGGWREREPETSYDGLIACAKMEWKPVVRRLCGIES